MNHGNSIAKRQNTGIYFLICYPMFIQLLLQFLFYFFNKQDFGHCSSAEEVFSIIWYACRFDLIVVLSTFFPIIIIALTWLNWKNWFPTELMTLLYTLVLILEVTLGVFDLLFFHMNHHRLTISDLTEAMNNVGLLGPYAMQYWYWVLFLMSVGIGSFLLVSTLFKRLRSSKYTGKNLVLVWVFYAAISFAAIFDFNTHHYFTPSSGFFVMENNHVPFASNSIVEILASRHYKQHEFVKWQFMPDDKAYASQKLIQHINNIDTTHKNVLIFIIESASREDFEESRARKLTMPFLDSLMQTSLVFDNFYSNGLSSPTGFDAIIGGLPASTAGDFFSTGYAYNNTQWFTEVLKKMHYQTSFYYGVNSFGQSFLKTAKGFHLDYNFGFQQFKTTGKNFDGYYGIFDDIFFKAASEEINKQQQPFLAVLYNVSTHSPFNLLPAAAMDSLPAFEKSNGKSLRYYDNVIKDFFNSSKKESWFSNSIFLFVADHFSRATDAADKSMLGIFKIPMFIYTTKGDLKGHYSYTAQQIDIPISVLQLAGASNVDFFSYGRNLFDTTMKNGIAFNYFGTLLQAIDDNYVLQYSYVDRKVVGYYSYKTDKALTQNLYDFKRQSADSLLKKLQVFWQLYRTTVIDNKMHPDGFPGRK